ncbi:SH3 domain-containing protein [Viridibacillus sp. YIM B01967]|uniref:SH3 domain-containing protein n=1 Tax=Viridibacillus soli TaxID=2798301 RepID=A0ABS1H271_9BACL|nr:SH3 domain-containing protein [Viridibacillus soli]MBK3493510.1 SH3 domain-containing protein [Viridibacillus soli]
MSIYNKKTFIYLTNCAFVSVGILLASSVIPFETTISPKKVEAATVKTYTATAKLSLRSKASTKGEILLTIPKGKSVSYISKTGSWYKVKYGTKTGYVTTSYIKVTTKTMAVSTFTATNYQTIAKVNLRSSSSTKGRTLLSIPKGKTVKATAKSGVWYKVTYGGKTGWVSSSYVKEYDAYKKTATTNYLTEKTASLRITPSTKKAQVYSIPANNTFTSTQSVVNSKGETWYRVSYKDKTYFVQSTVVSKVTPTQVTSTEYKANSATSLYAGAGVSHTKLTSIPKGAKLTSTDRIGNWYKVSYKGKTGYIDSTKFSVYTASADTTADDTDNSTPTLPSGSSISQKTIYNIDDLQLHQSNSTSSDLLKVIPANTKLKTTYKAKNGWYQVSHEGITGFVSGSYLIDETTKSRIASLGSNQNSYLFMDLRTNSSVTADQIDKYVASKTVGKTNVLVGQGQTIIKAANKYGVNALYLAAHAIHESGFGTSDISVARNNVFGFGAYDITPFIGAVKFDSIGNNLEFIAQSIKATYLNPLNWKYNDGAYLGYTVKDINGVRIDTLSKGMNFYYASDSNWGNAIANHMNAILAYDKEGAVSKIPNTDVPSEPNYPDLKDVFPNGTVAIANSDLNLYSKKGSTESVSATIAKGETFNLLEKYNDYWLTVSYKGKTYYINVKKFSTYNKFFTVKNLARVNTSLANGIALNVRSEGNSSSSKMGELLNYQFVELVIDKNNKPIMSGTWFKVKLQNGKQGYASGIYLIRELDK